MRLVNLLFFSHFVDVSSPGRMRALLSQVVWVVLRGCTLVLARRQVKIRAEGLEHIPRSWPVLIASRHFHYLYDGYILVRVVPRRLHTLIALDWLQIQGLRLLIELACGLADWPVVLRGAEMKGHGTWGRWVYQPAESRRYLRRVMQATVRLLQAGEVLVIFPEGYPNVDPHPTPKKDWETFLPFQPGFVKMAERAQKDGQTRVAIVPAGLTYTRVRGKTWLAWVRFGPALFLNDFANSNQALHVVEERVRALSFAQPSSVSSESPREVPLS